MSPSPIRTVSFDFANDGNFSVTDANTSQTLYNVEIDKKNKPYLRIYRAIQPVSNTPAYMPVPSNYFYGSPPPCSPIGFTHGYNLLYANGFQNQPNLGYLPQQMSTSPVGEVSYHRMSSKIDVIVMNEKMKLSRDYLYSMGHGFTHSAFGGSKLCWTDTEGLGRALKLKDVKGNTIAVFKKQSSGSSRLWGSLRKGEKKAAGGHVIDIFVPLEGPALDVVVVTGLATAELQKRENEAASEILEATASALGGVGA
jgi:hypothetical protein